MRKRTFIIIAALVALVAFLFTVPAEATTIQLTRTSNGTTSSGIFNADVDIAHTVRGKAPTGNAHVELDKSGLIIVTQFDISNSACRTENVGILQPDGDPTYSFILSISITNYISGTGYACLHPTSTASNCPSCGGS